MNILPNSIMVSTLCFDHKSLSSTLGSAAMCTIDVVGNISVFHTEFTSPNLVWYSIKIEYKMLTAKKNIKILVNTNYTFYVLHLVIYSLTPFKEYILLYRNALRLISPPEMEVSISPPFFLCLKA